MIGVQEALVSADAEGGVRCMDNMRVRACVRACVHRGCCCYVFKS